MIFWPPVRFPTIVLSFAVFFGIAASAFAQTRDATEEKRQLEATRYQREEARKEAQRRDKELQADIERLTKDSEALNARLIEGAKAVQASEAQLTSIEARLGELEAQDELIRGSLAKSHGSISSLLAAMQRMGRNPPPVMVTRREDALTMVRSAMLMASAFPELRGQAVELSSKLDALARIIDDSRQAGDRQREEKSWLEDNRRQVASLLEERKRGLAERQKELAQVRKDAADFARNITDINEFIGKLDKSIAEKTRLGAYERELAGNAAPSSTDQAAAPKRLPGAAKSADDLRPSITLQPGEKLAMASPGRIQPAIPFEQARGQLLLPAQGRQIQAFGDRTQSGRSDGIVIETRSGGQVIAPSDGWVMYAGEFRSYGQILIVNAGGGYHVLLAGLSQINAQVGDFVLAGEPIGLMVAASKSASVKTQETAPVLYVEFRKNQRPIDPGPWWAETARKVAG